MKHVTDAGNGILSLREAFDSSLRDEGRIDLKIGIDVGRTLFRIARLDPERFYVGVEIKPEKVKTAACDGCRKGLKNIALVNMEAHHFLQYHVPVDTFQRIYIFFPTPWPRSLNLPRRLVCRDFVEVAHKVLRKGGELRLVTDNEPYYDEMCYSFSMSEWREVSWAPVSWLEDSRYIVGTPTEKDLRDSGCQEFHFLHMVKR